MFKSTKNSKNQKIDYAKLSEKFVEILNEVVSLKPERKRKLRKG